MATSANIQVNANTQQAVGAFNALAASIAAAQQNTSQLNVSFSGTATTATAFASAIGNSNAQLNRFNLNVTQANQGLGQMNQAASGSVQVHSTMLTVFDQLADVLSKFFDVLSKVAAGVEYVFDSLVHELDKIQGFNAIMLVSTKSAQEAAQTYDFLRATADKLGVQFDAVASNYAKLVAAIPDGNNKMQIAESVFLGIAEAARTLHASNQDTQLMFYAVTQMAAKGVLSMEELRRQLAEKLPGALQIAARSVNATEAEFIAAVSKGSVDSIKFLQYFGDELVRTFHDSSEKASTSVSAAINRLTNVWVDFVKEVLDSGASQSIINMFDALREKLADPYVITQFSELIKNLGDKITSFIQGLTADDIRTGFDEFAKFIEVMTDVIGKLIQGITWLIDHAPQAGAILGGLTMAAAGATVAGPWGALAGGVVGAVGGAYAGRGVAPDAGDQMFRDQMAKQTADENARKAQVTLGTATLDFANAMQSASPKVLTEMDKFYKNLDLTTAQFQALTTILTGDRFKTENQKIGAIDDYAQYGALMNPRADSLKDVLNGKQKLTPHEKSLNATQEKAYGLDSDYPEQMANLNELYTAGRLTVEAYNKAVVDLVDKQPIEKANIEALKKSQEEYNKGMELGIDQAIAQVEVKEKIRTGYEDELKMAGMTTLELQAYNKTVQEKNELEKAGMDVDEASFKQMLLTNEAMNQKLELTKLGNQIIDQTKDKYLPQAKQQQAMNLMTKDPTSGFTKGDQTDFTVNQDPNMKGSDQYLDAQKKALQQYYDWVDTLRNKDVISEQTAQQAKGLAEAQYSELRLQSTDQMFKDLSSLSDSKSKDLSRIGKAAAIADATIQGYLAVQRAIAAPPGWPYNAGGVIAAGILTGATIAKITSAGSFEVGGYTGDDYATNEVAGVVHGQEFVVNASATAKNRAVLEQMNRGSAVTSGGVQSATGGQLAGMQIEVHNHGTPQDYSAQQMTENKVRLIANDVVRTGSPKAVADDMRNPNSQVSKSMRQNTLTARRRKGT